MSRNAAGVACSTLSRSPRVSARSSNCIPATASRKRRSSVVSASARAPTRSASDLSASLPGIAALYEGDHPGEHRHDEEDPGAGEQGAQAAVGPPLALGVALAGRAALVQELPLGGVQVVGGAPAPTPARPRAGRRGRGRRPRGRRHPTGGRRRPGGGAGAGPRGPRRASGAARATRGSAPRGRPRPCPRRGSRAARLRAGRAVPGQRLARRPPARGRRCPRAGGCPRCPLRARSAAGRGCAPAHAARRGRDSTSVSAVRATAEPTPPLSR